MSDVICFLLPQNNTARYVSPLPPLSVKCQMFSKAASSYIYSKNQVSTDRFLYRASFSPKIRSRKMTVKDAKSILQRQLLIIDFSCRTHVAAYVEVM